MEVKESLNLLEEEALRRYDIKSEIKHSFIVITKEIDMLLQKIKTCNNVDEARDFFERLLSIQEALAILLFKYDFKLPIELIAFVRSCDRLDDKRLQIYLFNKIKEAKEISNVFKKKE